MEILELLSIPAIIAIVEAIKATGYIDNRYVPLLAIGTGAVVGVVMGNLILGVVLGVTASGAYAQVKTLAGK
jgi:mannose/fructose/N-acetylgalactosamine-specific phosphotransferase system component IIC